MNFAGRKHLPVWLAAIVVAAYWALQLALALTDFATLSLFFQRLRGIAAFLLPFLVLWVANPLSPWRVRWIGLGVFGIASGLGALLVHPSIGRIPYLLRTVPWALTGWALWWIFSSLRRTPAPPTLLAAAILLPFAGLGLLRWDGMSGARRSSYSLRWTATAEQTFLGLPAREKPEGSTRAWNLKPEDWPEFRGPRRDGSVRGARIAPDWRSEGPQLLWKQRVGPGWSSIIVVDGFLVTQEQRGDSEAVVCYSADTGKTVWVYETAGRFAEGASGAGPRATPTFRDGRIFALGGTGILSCLEAATGKRIWSLDIAREAGAAPPHWGFSSSPLVIDGRVIVFAGGQEGRSVLALDAASGTRVWSQEGGTESYSSAQLAEFQGSSQILIADNRRLAGLAIADGVLLWQLPASDASTVPILQPHVLAAGALLVCPGTSLLRLEVQAKDGRWEPIEKWSRPLFRSSFNDFVVHGGNLFGLDDGVLTCVNPETGARVWKQGRYGSGQVALLVDQGLLLVVSEAGELALVEAGSQPPGEVLRVPGIQGKTWNHPAIVRDRLYLRNGVEMACFRLPSLKTR